MDGAYIKLHQAVTRFRPSCGIF